MNTAQANQELVEEDGRAWDRGYVVFDQDMKTDSEIFELLDVKIPSTSRVVNVLQMLVEYVHRCLCSYVCVFIFVCF